MVCISSTLLISRADWVHRAVFHSCATRQMAIATRWRFTNRSDFIRCQPQRTRRDGPCLLYVMRKCSLISTILILTDLIGAVLLDFNSHRLNQLAGKSKEVVVSTDTDIHGAALLKSHDWKKLYWITLGKYLLWHVWGLAATAALVLFFASVPKNLHSGDFVSGPEFVSGPDFVFGPPEITKDAWKPTIVFLSYVLAYTGLLWYQYTKVFSGPHALKPMLIGVSIGLPLGFILHHQHPTFAYTDVIALGTATWTVAILSLWAGKIIGDPEDVPLTTIKGKSG